ncbi:hypothetical protein ACPPVU_11970 [Mucilaginibacter sp. McL0603]|uniref:hypothetical protein n=1 Tax=Mucilaginibacter sp. McL0603 TaxID=3415670 RepID=UPI003CF5E570
MLIQQLINILYRFPKSKLKTYKRFGGYGNYRKMTDGSKKMKSAVYDLPVSMAYPDGLPVYFLTGEKYIHQTLFCINSLLKVSEEKYNFFLVDDGSFNNAIINLIAEKLPGATIVTADQISINLGKYLPGDKFPILNYKRKTYPHIKKLTDVHTISPLGWKLVLDSDMLFWKEPAAMNNWLKLPNQPIHMVDCEESYGYNTDLMQEICGGEIPSLLNVGVIGLNSTDLKWEKLEEWIQLLEEKEGTSYYLEQALTAMIVSGTQPVVLNKNDYKVNPILTDLETKSNILHHYVDLSKEVYYKKAWKLII